MSSKELVVGKSVEFYDQGSHEWAKGKVKNVRKEQGCFVYVCIEYWRNKKQHEINIYREDWLR